MGASRRAPAPRDDQILQRAVELHGSGRLREAETLYQGLVGNEHVPQAALHFVLGMVLADQDQPLAALDQYDRAALLGFVSSDLHLRRADLLRVSGRLLGAVTGYDEALKLNSQCAASAHHRGIALAALGRNSEAVSSYERALVFDPQNPRLLNNCGVALESVDRSADALKCYDRAIRSDAGYSFAHHNRGAALLKQAQFLEAAASFRRALALHAEQPETWNLLGMALGAGSSHAEALIAFDRALALRPLYPEALNNRSIALRWLGRFEAAVECASQAITLQSSFADAMTSRGAALARLNRHSEALDNFQAALAIDPASAAARLSLGLSLEALGDCDGALAELKAVESLDPARPDAKICAGQIHIRCGNWASGFDLYQNRWAKATGPFLPYPASCLWRGDEAIEGRTILLYGEQGFGDCIQFCRFATAVCGLGARVVLQVQAPLKRLAQTLAGPALIISLEEAAPPFDLHAPLMNLPSILGLSLDDLDGGGAYLTAPLPLVRRWKAHLGGSRRPLVGLAWSGNPLHENDHNRSLDLDSLWPLFDAPARFVSLQKAHRVDDLDRLPPSARLQCLGEAFEDFADVAAVIHHCDAVVTVDTAVAHLAGALGKPTSILLPRFCDWRWMNGRQDSPWYTSVRLMRQADFGDWSAPIAAAAAAIRRL